MGRVLIFAYGIIAYLIFFVTFLYAIGFVGGIVVPKDINDGVAGPLGLSVLINLCLLGVFALQHSIMARPGFKALWTKIIPKPIERSTYVVASSLALILLFWLWQPMPNLVWDFSGSALGTLLLAIHWAGWAIVLSSTFMIDHFDLFGLRQVFLHLRKQTYGQPGFRQMLLYKFVRHPIMMGFIIAFWATPQMSAGLLLFALASTVYIYIAVKHFEERDLVAQIGEPYTQYQREVGMLVPSVRKKNETAKEYVAS